MKKKISLISKKERKELLSAKKKLLEIQQTLIKAKKQYDSIIASGVPVSSSKDGYGKSLIIFKDYE